MNAELSHLVGEGLVNGKPSRFPCLALRGQVFRAEGTLLRTVRLEDEWHDDVDDPQAVVSVLRREASTTADIFTFRQRPPDLQRAYDFPCTPEALAVLEITSFDHWLKHQVAKRMRSKVRQALNRLDVRVERFDDAFVAGMTRIFNETPVRQGRPFWHYGKDFDTVKRQFARHIDRETMIGAYVEDEMVAFMMLSDAGSCCLPVQILSSIHHRDKAPTNALIAKAVELCAQRRIPYLIYFYWSDDGLGEFKRRNGFQRVDVPRYFVPLNRKGDIAVSMGLHRGIRQMLPPGIEQMLKAARQRFYTMRYGPS